MGEPMSDNKKYYYLKLKDNFFEQDSIRILESQENGYIHSLIILKLYLKACKYDGWLKMTETIPYSPDDVDTLAKVIGHDVDHVKVAISKAVKFGLVTILDSGQIWMTEIQNFIGHSSTEADRLRSYRKKLNTTDLVVQDVQMYDKSTPEIEIEIEKEVEPEEEKTKPIGFFPHIVKRFYNTYEQIHGSNPTVDDIFRGKCKHIKNKFENKYGDEAKKEFDSYFDTYDHMTTYSKLKMEPGGFLYMFNNNKFPATPEEEAAALKAAGIK